MTIRQTIGRLAAYIPGAPDRGPAAERAIAFMDAVGGRYLEELVSRCGASSYSTRHHGEVAEYQFSNRDPRRLFAVASDHCAGGWCDAPGFAEQRVALVPPKRDRRCPSGEWCGRNSLLPMGHDFAEVYLSMTPAASGFVVVPGFPAEVIRASGGDSRTALVMMLYRPVESVGWVDGSGEVVGGGQPVVVVQPAPGKATSTPEAMATWLAAATMESMPGDVCR